MGYRLVVSKELEFDVKFTLADGANQREFGFRAAAVRTEPASTLKVTVGDYLENHCQLRMLSWIGDPPIETEDGQKPEPGKDALAALYSLLPTLPGDVLAAYTLATGPKAKLGN
jgi:hypothetical protein